MTTLYPTGYQNRKVSLAELERIHGGRMIPEYRRRLFAMIRAARGLVGIGGGYRSNATQAANYARDPKTFAPPGFSFHESHQWATGHVGYAAVDTVGVDGRHREAWDWIAANAHRFGLVDFSAVNREPWHVQIAELPKSVREWKAAGSPYPATFDLPTESYVPVVDVSKWQGEIDWAKMASTGVQGAIVRAGNGKKPGRDPRFFENVAGANAAGLAVGSYYWVRPFDGDPEGQADAWLAEVSDAEGDVRFLMIDAEWNDVELGPEATSEFLRAFLLRLREKWAKPIVGYSSAAYWNANVGDGALAASLDGWIVPAYPKNGEVPPVPASEWYRWAVDSRKRPSPPIGVDHWDGWQFSDDLAGPEYGVQSNGLDGNLVQRAAWEEWTGTVPAPPPPPPPPVDPPPPPVPSDPEGDEVVVNVKLRKLSRKTSGVVQDVRRLQGLLNAQSGAGLEMDGKFGPKTEAKVRDWQTFFGLEVDGIVGPKTWTSLLEVGT